jgi:hypothetical protein
MAPRLATQQSKGLPSNPTITWDAYSVWQLTARQESI